VDVAVVVDGSMSTGLRTDNSILFRRAVEEARRAAAATAETDTVALILAGPGTHGTWLEPTSETARVNSALDSLAARGPTGGSMNLPAALEQAADTLSRAPNAGKRIVVVSDGQRHGWRTESTGAWRVVADAIQSLPTGARIIHRNVPPPEDYVNLSVLDVQLPNRALLPGWPVTVAVTVQNTGTAASPTRTLELTAAETTMRTQEVGGLLPGDSRTLQFDLTFEHPGRHVVRAALSGPEDALPADDSAARVAYLVDDLRVLVVDGRPEQQLLESASDYIVAALAPRPAAGGLQPEVATLENLPGPDAWDDYEAVVLANVTRLPERPARALAVAVQGGVGLLIAPGAQCDPEFYNTLATADAAPVSPAELEEFVAGADEPARPALDTFQHPALRPLAEPEPSDISTARIQSWWRLTPRTHPSGDTTVRAELSTGAPLLAAWSRGRGQVIVTAPELHHRSGNLVTRRAFVPMIHELIYNLSAGSFERTNVATGAPAALRIQRPDGTPLPPSVDVLTPSGEALPAGVAPSPEGAMVHFARTEEPGLYRVTIPGQQQNLPFAVIREPEETSRARLTEADLARIGRHVDIFHAEDTDAVISAVQGRVPGREMWRQMLLCALAVLLAEVAVGHWVNVRRRAETAREVEFGNQRENAASLRERFRRGRASSGAEERA
jgi:hypothetical protein